MNARLDSALTPAFERHMVCYVHNHPRDARFTQLLRIPQMQVGNSRLSGSYTARSRLSPSHKSMPFTRDVINEHRRRTHSVQGTINGKTDREATDLHFY